jgi:hypothetical protein
MEIASNLLHNTPQCGTKRSLRKTLMKNKIFSNKLLIFLGGIEWRVNQPPSTYHPGVKNSKKKMGCTKVRKKGS